MLTIIGRLEGQGAGWRDFAEAVVIYGGKETDHSVQLSGIGKSTMVT